MPSNTTTVRRRGRWLTVRQAADEYPFTESALRHHIEDRVLPVHRVGRRVFIAEADLDDLIEAGRQEAIRPRRRRTTNGARPKPDADNSLAKEPTRWYPNAVTTTSEAKRTSGSPPPDGS